MSGAPGNSEPDSQAEVLVKICGITRDRDARACVELGVDWVGLNCWPRSRRYIPVSRAVELAALLRSHARATGAARAPRVVGLFVDQPEDQVRRAADAIALDMVQLHGHEPEAMCTRLQGDGYRVIKALGLAGPEDAARLAGYPCDIVLADTPSAGFGGSGRIFDWSLAGLPALADRRVVLAGGLTADNVGRAIAATRPYAVDTASGVESASGGPGVKDRARIAAFIAAVR